VRHAKQARVELAKPKKTAWAEKLKPCSMHPTREPVLIERSLTQFLSAIFGYEIEADNCNEEAVPVFLSMMLPGGGVRISMRHHRQQLGF
jgi:hypothetical protein